LFNTPGQELSLVTKLHKATTRDYLGRMNDSKVEAMKIAKKYGEEYWDGDRRYGYGGHRYIEGRWKPVAEALIGRYKLSNASSVLDIGCGKGYLLFEIQRLLPEVKLTGIDFSEYAIQNSHPDLNAKLIKYDARNPLKFKNKEFDLAISLATFHNFHLYELETAITEVERVAKSGYIMVESYRNELEMFNLECWALTAECLMDVDEWKWFFNKVSYNGDYEFIFFE